jgi:metal-responsive CopG/Arc/MetJ family transcriptional regulator
MRSKYTNVAIPESLAKEIDKMVASSPLGYTSRAQFVLEAIRTKIELSHKPKK